MASVDLDVQLDGPFSLLFFQLPYRTVCLSERPSNRQTSTRGWPGMYRPISAWLRRRLSTNRPEPYCPCRKRGAVVAIAVC